MIILDENIIDSQRRQLKNWRIPIRQIGYEVGRKGMKDQEIISFLHQQQKPTLVTRDDDFYNKALCHAGYCLIFLDVRKEEVAIFTRRVLRHPSFKTKIQRMGKIIRTSHIGLRIWEPHAIAEELINWTP